MNPLYSMYFVILALRKNLIITVMITHLIK